MHTKAVFLSILLLSFSLVRAQSNHWANKGDSLLRVNKLVQAVVAYGEALDQYKLSRNQKGIEETTIKLAKVLYNQASYRESAALLNAASIQSPLQQFKKLRLLGDLEYAGKSDYLSAINYYDQAKGLIPKIKHLGTTDERDLFFYMGEAYNELRRSDRARQYFTKSSQAAMEINAADHVFLGKYRTAMAKTYIAEQKPQKAKEQLQRAFNQLNTAMPEDSDYHYHWSHMHEVYAYLYERLGRSDSVIYHGDQEIHHLKLDTKPNVLSLAQAYASTAHVKIGHGLLTEATDYLEQSISLYEANVEKEHRGLAYAYMVKGSLLVLTPASFAEALDHYRVGLNVYQKLYGKDHIETAPPNVYVGTALSKLGRHEEALSYHRKALEISMKNRHAEYTVMALFEIGSELVALNRIEEAETNLEQGWQILSNAMGAEFINNARFATKLSQVYGLQNKLDKAWAHLKQAEKILKFNYGQVHPRLSTLYLEMGRHQHAKNQKNEALDYLEKAAKANVIIDKHTKESTQADLSISIEIGNEKATIWTALYEEQGDVSLLLKAREQYMTNASTLLVLMLESTRSDDQNLYSNLRSETFKGALTVTEMLFKQTDSTRLEEELFLLAEHSKSILLRRQMLRNTAIKAQQSNDSSYRKLISSKEELSYYKTLFNQLTEQDTIRKEQYWSRMFSLRKEIKKASSRYLTGQNDTEDALLSMEMKQLQNTIPEGTTIIEYAQTKDKMFVFIVDQEQYHYRSISNIDSITYLIETFHKALQKQDHQAFLTNAAELYDALLREALSLTKDKRLIIVPDGVIWDVNFDLLITKAAQANSDLRNVDYLLKTHTTSRTYSAFSLMNEQKAKNTATKNLLALAYDVDRDNTPELGIMRNSRSINLPGTAVELESIDRLLKGDFYYGAAASEHRFKTLAADYQILHLALHAEAHETKHENARMFLTINKKDTLEDGLLHSYELYNMHLNADLAVLSACNTGGGLFKPGEGIMSLGRAFQFAGVKSVVLSQWDVSDAAAPEIIRHFYKNLIVGLPKDEALRQAKLQFLESANNISADPFYWGSFFIMGDTSPIQLKKAPKTIVLWIILSLLLVGITYLLIRCTKVKRLNL